MPDPYKVKCLDARYDEDSGFLILNCHFFTLGSIRLVYLHKSDFTYKGHPDVPDIEMARTAMLFRTKRPEFNLVIEDDPSRETISDKDYAEHVKAFTGRIEDELGKVSDGLVDEASSMQRRLGRLMDEGKLDAKKLLENEIAVRAKLSSLGG
jgi:hypothetical protein